MNTGIEAIEKFLLELPKYAEAQFSIGNWSKTEIEAKYGQLLTALRMTIFELFAAEHLKLEKLGNNIPDCIQNLKKLKSLDFSNCGLTEIPKCIYTLYKLEHLDFSNNKLIAIPNDFTNFINRSWVHSINFANNNIFAIPKNYKYCTFKYNFEGNPNNPKAVGYKKLKYKRKFRVEFVVKTETKYFMYASTFYLYVGEPEQNLIQKIQTKIKIESEKNVAYTTYTYVEVPIGA
jgi:hypothetical protein